MAENIESLAVGVEINNVLDLYSSGEFSNVLRHDGGFFRFLLIGFAPLSVDVIPTQVSP